MIINKAAPIFVACFPSLLLTYLPIVRPANVNVKLKMENIEIARIIFDVIVPKAIPVEKESIETPKAKKKISIRFKLNLFSASFLLSINILIASIIRIIEKINLPFKENIWAILNPNAKPIKGMIKCIIPTVRDKIIVFLFPISLVPIAKDMEKASIDKAIAMNSIAKISFKKKTS